MRYVCSFALGAVLLVGLQAQLFAQGPAMFDKYCGHLSIPYAMNDSGADDPAQIALNPNPELDCTNGVDDDGDGPVDFDDTDCQGDLQVQNVKTKLNWRVITSISGTDARFNGRDRSGDSASELVLNTTGPGGVKQTYLHGEDSYTAVGVRSVYLPGLAGNGSSPAAVRIQGDGQSYYAAVNAGNAGVSIELMAADGTSSTLANAVNWASGEAISIEEYDFAAPTCYIVDLSANGANLSLTVTESTCDPYFPAPTNDRTVTIEASDTTLGSGAVGALANGDLGGDTTDDVASADGGDSSILDAFVYDPGSLPPDGAPKVLWMRSGSGGRAAHVYTDPISSNDGNPFKRIVQTHADDATGSYLQLLGFDVDTVTINALSSGIMTTEDINENYDLVVIPGSGGSSATRTFAVDIHIPFMVAEHIAGRAEWAGLYDNNSGNERQFTCAEGSSPVNGRPTHLHIFTEEEGGSPDHPIVAGIPLDGQNNVEIANASYFDLNLAAPLLGNVTGMNGAEFLTVEEVLTAKDEGLGSQTQMAGWPLAEGGFQLAGMANPCDGTPIHQVDPDTGELISAQAGIALAAFETGTQTLDHGPCIDACAGDPDCIALCDKGTTQARKVFYWFDDTSWPYSSQAAIDIFRRAAMWSLGMLDSPNRSSLPFGRGDANDDGATDISDALFSLNHLFVANSDAPPCLDAADANDDEALDIADAVFTLNFLFVEGSTPISGFRSCFSSCMLDFTPSAEAEAGGATVLSCAAYSSCR